MEALILKYLTNEISPTELEILRKWLKKSSNKKLFENYIRDAYLLNRSNNSIDLNASYEKVWQKIQNQEKPVRKLFSKKRVYAMVASVAILVGVGAVLYNQIFLTANKFNNQSLVTNTIKSGTDKAILTLEDGSEVALEKDKSYKNKNFNSNGQEIVYGHRDNAAKEILFNYLTIPRGGQYSIKLSDGTQVWLNSESKLKFPVAFVKGESRDVELLYGEAYFEVSPSTFHKGSHFNVKTQGQNIEVLGTQFNIKAYDNEKNIYTTLVEGKVKLTNNKQIVQLQPNQQIILNKVSNNLETKSVDVYNYIAWKQGVFSFEEMPLKDIMKILERWYDVKVEFKTKKTENILFSGVFYKNLKIEEILNLINKTNNVTYEINQKTILLK